MDAAKKPCLARLKMLPAIGSPTEPCPHDYHRSDFFGNARPTVWLTILEPVPATK